MLNGDTASAAPSDSGMESGGAEMKRRRIGATGDEVNYEEFRRFDSLNCENNSKLDFSTKAAALKVCRSVVCLKSCVGGKLLFICSGTAINFEEDGGRFCVTILTSATLLQSSAEAHDIEIEAYLLGGLSFKGEVLDCEPHYNIALVKIALDAPLPVPVIKYIDDSMAFDPSRLCHHGSLMGPVESSQFVIRTGDALIALGRDFKDRCEIMAAPGAFSNMSCGLDCKELLMTTCNITKIGIGGPLINQRGEVIGMNFYDTSGTPFLPMNLVSRCLARLKQHRSIPRPWFGVEAVNLYQASFDTLWKIRQKSPGIVAGVIVKQVEADSPAYRAGLLANDVIVQCGGNFVGSPSELIEALWDEEGKPVELFIIRASTGEHLYVTVESVSRRTRQYRWLIQVE